MGPWILLAGHCIVPINIGQHPKWKTKNRKLRHCHIFACAVGCRAEWVLMHHLNCCLGGIHVSSCHNQPTDLLRHVGVNATFGEVETAFRLLGCAFGRQSTVEWDLHASGAGCIEMTLQSAWFANFHLKKTTTVDQGAKPGTFLGLVHSSSK